MLMTQLLKGQTAKILSVAPSPLRTKLLELGAIPGSIVERVLGSPTGGTGCYLICGALIALREDDAATIDVV